MALPARSGPARRGAPGTLVVALALGALPVALTLLVALALLLPGQPVSAQSDADGGPMASFLAELLEPEESFAPVELELAGSLPRSATFRGVELVVDRVRLTNTHPYTIFGEPRPGELYYVVVELTARNPQEWATEYGFGDETFGFRTWSGRLLPVVESPGELDFRRLEPGEEASDLIVFGSEVPDVLDGSALLVGRAPDSPLIIPLTAPPLMADYPTPVSPAAAGPHVAGVIEWSVLGGEAGLERPLNVCCPDTGDRADEGELFVTLELSGRVSGSQYGQATVSSDAVRLVVDGEPQPPLEFDGRANTPEGEAYEFALTWVAHEDDPGLALQLLDGADVVETVPIVIGATAPLTAPLPSAAPSAPSSAAPSAPSSAAPSAPSSAAPSSAAPIPTPAASPAAAPAPAQAVPTPRPATAALSNLLIYSGVPDPYWSLTAEDLEQLEAIAARLSPTEGVPPEGGLGYRGFRVTGPQGTWRVNGGVVLTPDSAAGTALADPERLVERFLLESGLALLTAEEVDIVEQAIGAASE